MADVKSNIVDLEKVVDNLNKTLSENINRLNLGALAVRDFTSSFSNIPSQYLKLLSDLADKNKTLQETQRRLLQVENDLAQLRQRQNSSATERNRRTAEEIVNQRTLAQNADRQARANSTLVGAYQNLNAQHQIASRRLQDLIVRGRTATQTQSQYNRELREAQRDFQNLDRRVQSADRAVGRFNRNVGNYPRQAISGLKELIGAFGIAGGISIFASLVKDIFQTTKELQSLDNALKQVTGTNEQFASSQQFLKDISEAFGLEIKGLTQQFTQFYVSAKDKLSATEIENIFRSISKAGAVMGLSVDAQNRAFLALNQMMSKGTVQAEELRGQLGEALPGAFGIMAKAVGVTEKELQNMMKAGLVLADEVLPKFAKELEKVYGIETIDRVETLSASTGRLSNNWTELVRSLNDSESGGISKFFKVLTDGLSSILGLLARANKGIADFKKEVYAGSKNTIVENVTGGAQQSAQSIISGQIKRGEKPDDLKELTRLKEIEYATRELGYQQDKYAVALKRVEDAEFSLGIQKEKSANFITGGIFNIRSLNKAEKTYQDAILETQRIKGNIDGLNSILNKKEKENTDIVVKNTEKTKANTKAKKEAEIYQVGSVKWLQQQISQLKELNDTLSTTSEEYQVGAGAIQFYEQWLERLTGTAKKAKEELDSVSLDLGGSEFLTDAEGDEIMEAGNKLRQTIKDLKSDFIDTFASESGFSGLLDIMAGGLDKFEGDAISTALVISEAFQEAFNTISEASQRNFDAEYARLEEQRDFAIDMAGGSATAREEIERQYDEKRRAIQRREAEAQKRLALFNILINTAQAVVSALPNIPLSIAIGVIGAVQAGIVASQEIPQFWRGTENAPEGLAWTQEKGAEVITDKSGNVKTLGSNKGAQLTYLSKGDKVYKSHEDYINKVLSKNGIDDLGSYINFAPPKEVNNSFDMVEMKQEFSKLASVIKNKEGVNISIDKKGFLTKKGNTEFINSRLNLTSRQV